MKRTCTSKDSDLTKQIHVSFDCFKNFGLSTMSYKQTAGSFQKIVLVSVSLVICVPEARLCVIWLS